MSTGVKRTAAPPAPGGSGGGAGPGPAKKGAGAGESAGAASSSNANGSGPTPLTYSSGEPAGDVSMSEVEGKVTIEVVLPSGPSSSVTVDFNIPMRDLLVHLAARFKVAPTGHVLQVLDEETGKGVDFKPSQTIGSLGASTVYIVPKNKKAEWGKAIKANKASKAFEITNRFTINLPGGQKAVMRISPQLTLEQVFARVCQDKSLDSRRYTLQHPSNPLAPLDLKATIADSRLSEINLIRAGASSSVGESSRSMPDLHRGAAAMSASQDPASWYMPGSGETKKKRGFLSFLSKKEKKFKPQQAHYPTENRTPAASQPAAATLPQPRTSTTPPAQRRTSDTNVATSRPKTMYVTRPGEETLPRGAEGGISVGAIKEEARAPPPRKGAAGKKRPAPPPPQKKAVPAAAAAAAVPSTSETVKTSVVSSTPHSSSKAPESLSVASVAAKPEQASGLSRLHSRNSSDSGGYHELTLSGAESPEAARVPTTLKTSIDTTSIESADHPNGDSGIQDLSPPGVESSSRLGHPVEGGAVFAGAGGKAAHTSSLQRPASEIHSLGKPDKKPKPLPSTKKKKAPPPPPKAKPAPLQEETVDGASSHPEPPKPQVTTSVPDTGALPPPAPPTQVNLEMDATTSAEQSYPNEMARFVAQMSPLTTDIPVEGEDLSSNDTSVSLPETDSVSDTGSVIRHGQPYHARGDSKDSQSSLSSLGHPGDSSSLDGGWGQPAASMFAMTEEIDAPMETVPPPLEFQSDEKEDDEEEEEEEVVTVTEEYIFPVGPGGMDYRSAIKVSEEVQKGSKEKEVDSPAGVFRAEPVSIPRIKEDVVEEKKAEKPAVKEEFVLTSEDLSCVSLVPPRPKVFVPSKLVSKPVVIEPELQPEPEPDYDDEPLNSESLVRPPVSLSEVSSLRSGPVTSDEITVDFQARHQQTGERQDPETSSGKPMSSLFLPSMRYSRGVEPMTFSDDERSSESSNGQVHRTPGRQVTGNRTGDDASDTSSDKTGEVDSRRMSNASSASQSLPSQGDGDMEMAREELQQQYGALQDQFVLWQQQLQQNQALLTAYSGGSTDAGDDTFKTLQAQVQMQQQMMTQLQMSMQALTMQQKAVEPVDVPTPTVPIPVEESPAKSSLSPPSYPPPPPPPDEPPAPLPPPPPPSAPVPKVIKAGSKTKTSAASRFEPQLDPREQLMIAIRSFGGRGNLNTVPAKATKWVHSSN